MDDIEQMRLNAFRKNERLMKKLQGLIPNGGKPAHQLFNFKYVVEYDIPYQQLSPQSLVGGILQGGTPLLYTKTFVTHKSRVFCCKSIECALLAVGTLSTGEAAKIEILPWRRNVPASTVNQGQETTFNFEWQVRDSGTDGQWQNKRLPANALLSGTLAPLKMTHGRTLRGGSEVTVDIFVTAMNVLSSGPLFPLTDIFSGNPSSFTLQMGFFGVEYDAK